ncbi:MAG: hypothetical protein MJE77_27710, partial [Proteobacteria bacterium]|nr:hypothetical protein [Pseudomonadota bacterium]
MQSDHNKTTLDTNDLLEMAVDMAGNTEPKLFGETETRPLDSEPPVLSFIPSLVYDEEGDQIVFDNNAVLTHFGQGPPSDLADPDHCPTVHKHVTRLHAGDSNPLRWNFSVTDPGVGLRPDGVEYRVRIPSQ